MTLFAGTNLVILLAGESPVFFPAQAAAPPKTTTDDAPLRRDNPPTVSYASVVKKVSPSVVNIYTSKTLRFSPAVREYLREMLGDDRVPRERREQALGSGIIVSSDGYILTNNHVVEGAEEVKVALSDEKTVYDAKIIGTDPQSDVAVVKVPAENLPAITFADSGKIEVGDVTIAIGDPFGVGQTVTMGIVSAKDRGGMGITSYEEFIQTDAAHKSGQLWWGVGGCDRAFSRNEYRHSKSNGRQSRNRVCRADQLGSIRDGTYCGGREGYARISGRQNQTSHVRDSETVQPSATKRCVNRRGYS